MDTETTYVDEADVHVCNNCGACAGTVVGIKHYATCKKGEAKKWEKHCNDANQEELEIKPKGERPTKEELFTLVVKYSFKNVGKMYGVWDTAIIRWCKEEGIPFKRRELMEIYNAM